MSKSFNQRLDAVANATGIPQLTARRPKRRPLRGLAILSLVLGTAGMLVSLAGPVLMWIGEAVLMIGFAVSGWLVFSGPIKPWLSGEEPVDERDEAVRANAYLAALPAIMLAAIAALVGLPALGWLQHRGMPEMLALGGFAAIYLVLLWNAVPTLTASWNAAPADEDDA